MNEMKFLIQEKDSGFDEKCLVDKAGFMEAVGIDELDQDNLMGGFSFTLGNTAGLKTIFFNRKGYVTPALLEVSMYVNNERLEFFVSDFDLDQIDLIIDRYRPIVKHFAGELEESFVLGIRYIANAAPIPPNELGGVPPDVAVPPGERVSFGFSSEFKYSDGLPVVELAIESIMVDDANQFSRSVGYWEGCSLKRVYEGILSEIDALLKTPIKELAGRFEEDKFQELNKIVSGRGIVGNLTLLQIQLQEMANLSDDLGVSLFSGIGPLIDTDVKAEIRYEIVNDETVKKFALSVEFFSSGRSISRKGLLYEFTNPAVVKDLFHSIIKKMSANERSFYTAEEHSIKQNLLTLTGKTPSPKLLEEIEALVNHTLG